MVLKEFSFSVTQTLDKKNLKELVLVFFAVFCHFLTCLNFYSLNNYLKISDTFFSGNQLNSEYWVVVCFIGRILGVCILGKYAQRFGFFKSMHLISGLFLILDILFAIFCFSYQYAHEIDERFYFFRLFYCFLQPGALILPSIYLFNRNHNSNHFMISAYLVLAIFIAKFISYRLKSIQLPCLELWISLPIITTFLSLSIYWHLQKFSVHSKNELSKSQSIPSKVKILSILLGAACATGIFYNHTFLSSFLLNTSIIEPNIIFSRFSYYSLWAFFILPGAKISQRFGFYKTSLISLAILFILSIFPLLSNLTFTLYIAHQLLFAFFSAIFIAPILATLYKLFDPYSDTYHHMLWFVIGFSLCIFIAFFEKDIVFQNSATNIGCYAFSTSLVLCFLVIFKFGPLILSESAHEKSC